MPETSTPVTAIWADLLREIATATDRAATRMAALTEPTPVDEPETPPVRSTWGRKVLRLRRLGLEEGLTTKEVANGIGHRDEPNAHGVLVTLAKQGLVEEVPGTTPMRWRLPREQRRHRILRASRLIERGWWTTYGDMAIAIYDDRNVALAIARVASRNPAFANPHRVLAQGGVIAKGWKDGDLGPEECVRRLAADGIRLDDQGRAPADRRIPFDELRTRLAALDFEGDEI